MTGVAVRCARARTLWSCGVEHVTGHDDVERPPGRRGRPSRGRRRGPPRTVDVSGSRRRPRPARAGPPAPVWSGWAWVSRHVGDAGRAQRPARAAARRGLGPAVEQQDVVDQGRRLPADAAGGACRGAGRAGAERVRPAVRGARTEQHDLHQPARAGARTRRAPRRRPVVAARRRARRTGPPTAEDAGRTLPTASGGRSPATSRGRTRGTGAGSRAAGPGDEGEPDDESPAANGQNQRLSRKPYAIPANAP